MNDDAATRNPATVSFDTTLGENAGGVLFGDVNTMFKRSDDDVTMRRDAMRGPVRRTASTAIDETNLWGGDESHAMGSACLFLLIR